MNDTTETNCTCPSGNGSLRHPCPAHFDQRAAGNPAAAQAAVAYNAGGIELTACQLHEALLMAGSPELDVEFDDRSRVRIFHTENGHSGPGLYCECVDVEEEGCILLDGTSPAIAAPVAAAPVEYHVSDRDRAILQKLQDALPTAGINGWAEGVEVLERILRTTLASTPAAPGIDPADPWRGLYAPELMPELDGVNAYHVAHPDLPSWPKGEDEERGVSPLIKAQGFELEAVFGEYPEEDDEDPDYCAWLAQWQPTPPTGEHWRLVCIQDTEDGPAAFYVRPFALIDASPKGDAPRDDRFPGGFADAIAYADEMEEGAGRLYEQVIGFEDGSHTGTDMLAAVLRELQDSPKGGSIDAKDAARWRVAREQNGVTISVEEADDDGDMHFVSGHTPEELDAAMDAMQATSAEVGE